MWRLSFLWLEKTPRAPWRHLVFRGSGSNSLLDARRLARAFAQIVQLGATHLASLVHLDAIYGRRLDGEYTLHTYRARHLANGETLLLAVTANPDDNAAIELDALLGTLDDFVTHGNRVARLELGILFAGRERFLSNFN